LKNASTDLINLLNSNREFTTCDLYTFTLTAGTSLRYTSADRDVVYNGNSYSRSLKIDRQDIKAEKGLSVDSLSVSIKTDNSNLVGIVPFLQAFKNGVFDGSFLQIDKAFFTSWTAAPLVLEKLFFGKIDVDNLSRTEIKLEIKSVTEILNTSIPKNIYQSGCIWNLYDSNTCKAPKSGISGSILANSTKNTINCNLAESAGYFDAGIIVFTSGANNDLKRTVKSYTPGTIVLVHPLPNNPSYLDTFTVYKGCSKTLEDCANKYNNKSNIGAFPFVPNTDTAY
jgi:uncharacterized phage protein (TIGR02218 family)